MKPRLLLAALAASVTVYSVAEVTNLFDKKDKEYDKNAVTRSETIAPFAHVSVSNNVEVKLVYADRGYLYEARTTPDLMECLSVKVEDSVLTVKVDKKHVYRPIEMKLFVPSGTTFGDMKVKLNTASELDAPYLTAGNLTVDVSTAADFDVDRLTVKSLSLSMSSGSDASFDVLNINGALKVDVSTAGDFDVDSIVGTITEARIDASSGSDVDIDNSACSASSIFIDSSSGSDVKWKNLDAQKLTCECSSGSDIGLSGKAEEAKLKASSGGDISARGLNVVVLDASASSRGVVAVGKVSTPRSIKGDVKYTHVK